MNATESRYEARGANVYFNDRLLYALDSERDARLAVLALEAGYHRGLREGIHRAATLHGRIQEVVSRPKRYGLTDGKFGPAFRQADRAHVSGAGPDTDDPMTSLLWP